MTGKNYLDDLRNVGPDKPLGYLPVCTIRDLGGIDPLVLQAELEQRGLSTALLSCEEFNIDSEGALFAWDDEALQRHLDHHRDVLEASGWGTAIYPFLTDVIQRTAPSGTKLFDVIADAFADHENKGRSDKADKPPGANLPRPSL